jgi:hypothetical protein
VQPGDELLRIALVHLKQCELKSRGQNPPSSELERTSGLDHSREAQVFVENLKQLHLLSVGCNVSPHNYAFQIDILEPLRAVCCGDVALHWFRKMDVKHMQLDSMSYLIVPALVESGPYLLSLIYASFIYHYFLKSCLIPKKKYT